MERYSTYNIDFSCKLPDGNREKLAVRGISIQVVAKDIAEAMRKAWDAVRITPEDYEIDQITRNVPVYKCSWCR